MKCRDAAHRKALAEDAESKRRDASYFRWKQALATVR